MNSHQGRKANRIMLRLRAAGGVTKKEKKFMAEMFPGLGSEMLVVKKSDMAVAEP